MARNPVVLHYGRAGIAERVLAAARAAGGPDAPITPALLAPFDHFHGRGVVATEALAALLEPQPGERLLDIGCGIGGPARWIAERYGVHVTGVDLTPEFCEAARALNTACSMNDRVAVIEGSALALPLPDGGFDRAYSHNVVMNIADKPGFYREAFRVLRPGGKLALANACAGPAGPPYFPVPWATTPETSFLATPDETRTELIAAGFAILSFRDLTEAALQDLANNRARLQRRPGVPVLHPILGERMREMQANSARSQREGRMRAIEVLVSKPAQGV